MGKTKRIIPCLDIDNRRVVKGKEFLDVKEVADPLTLARKYDADGADELVFYDISASLAGRGLFLDLIKEIADAVSIPFIVGGGIQSMQDLEKVFAAGADKVSINSAALRDPEFLRQASERYSSSRVILSMDVRKTDVGKWEVYASAGMKPTGMDALDWAMRAEKLGAGELVVNSIDGDGMRDGYDLALYEALNKAVGIPVIASGGAGNPSHFEEVLQEGRADAALAASVFHFGDISIKALKNTIGQGEIPCS